jgi:succinate dehydrogenase/fumarate reductase flavoprotein subunit
MLADLDQMLEVAVRRPEELQLQNMTTVGTLLAHAAWYRQESRGTHTRIDFPARDDVRWRGHVAWSRASGPTLHPEAGSGIGWT